MRSIESLVKGSVILLTLSLGSTGAWAAESAPQTNAPPASASGGKGQIQAQETEPTSGPPLPVHTTEGYGGGAITPTAYLVNPGPKGQVFGLPSISGTFVGIGQGKNVETFAVTETLFDRVELGYGASRFGIGDVKDDIKRVTGVGVRDDVWLYNFNLRGLIVEENSGGQSWVPAITAGFHYKINDGIDEIDKSLGGAFKNIGMTHTDGYDFTLTASKTIAKVFGRPLIISAGGRNSSAAWEGYLGFGDKRSFTFEGNVIYVPLDWLAVGYEYRGKTDPYSQIPGLVEGENDLQTVDVVFMPNKRLSIALVYGAFGKVLNHNDNAVGAVQVKWLF